MMLRAWDAIGSTSLARAWELYTDPPEEARDDEDDPLPISLQQGLAHGGIPHGLPGDVTGDDDAPPVSRNAVDSGIPGVDSFLDDSMDWFGG
jgi:hypothetical protein